MIIVLLSLAFLLTYGEAGADIYRYLDRDGVECFSDAPGNRQAVKIIKEPAVSRSRIRKQALASSPPAETAQLSGIGHPDSGRTRGETSPGLPVRGWVSSPVGLRHDPIDGVLRDHKGVDIATPSGTPVHPVAAGVVSFSGYRQGYGNTVIVRHNDGMTTLYAHNLSNLKTAGEPVDKDSTIAFSGSSGRTTGPHLHFEAWQDGINKTALFVPGAASTLEADRHSDGIKRFVQADGTLVFTNLP